MNPQIKRLIAWLAEWHRRRRELEQLSQMDDYLLRDIGLTKEDVQSILKIGKFPVRRSHSSEREQLDCSRRTSRRVIRFKRLD